MLLQFLLSKNSTPGLLKILIHTYTHTPLHSLQVLSWYNRVEKAAVEASFFSTTGASPLAKFSSNFFRSAIPSATSREHKECDAGQHCRKRRRNATLGNIANVFGPALAADFVVGAIHSRAASQSRGITQEERIGHYSIHVADIPEYWANLDLEWILLLEFWWILLSSPQVFTLFSQSQRFVSFRHVWNLTLNIYCQCVRNSIVFRNDKQLSSCIFYYPHSIVVPKTVLAIRLWWT